MTVRELKDILATVDDEKEVMVYSENLGQSIFRPVIDASDDTSPHEEGGYFEVTF